MTGIPDDRLALAGIEVDQLSGLGRRDFWAYVPPARVWIESWPRSEGGPDAEAYPILEWRRAVVASSKREQLPRPTGRCLMEFIRLDVGDDADFAERVRAFAEHWGPLGICRHGKPRAHEPECQPLGTRVLASRNSLELLTWEPIEAWMRYVRQLSGLLNLAVELRQGLPGRPKDWEAVQAGEPPLRFRYADRRDGFVIPTGKPIGHTPAGELTAIDLVLEPESAEFWGTADAPVELQQMFLGDDLDHWLRYGAVGVRARWLPGQPQPRVDEAYGGLPGVLAVELATLLKSPVEPVRCHGCGRVVGPGDRARGNRRVWCALTRRCDKNAQERDWWDRVGKNRRRAGRRLNSAKEGESAEA